MIVVKRTARKCEINRLVVEGKRPIPGRVQSFVWFSTPVGVIFYSKRGGVSSFALLRSNSTPDVLHSLICATMLCDDVALATHPQHRVHVQPLLTGSTESEGTEFQHDVRRHSRYRSESPGLVFAPPFSGKFEYDCGAGPFTVPSPTKNRVHTYLPTSVANQCFKTSCRLGARD